MIKRIKKTHLNNLFIICLLGVIFQSCSWRHFLIVKNPTEFTWIIEYTVTDERGLFNYQGGFIKENVDGQSVPHIKTKLVRFEIKPNQSDTLGFTHNSDYNYYKNYREFDERFKRKAFLNVDTIYFYNGEKTFKYATCHLCTQGDFG